MPRPSEAIFADGSKRKPLAIRPDAIGVSFPTRSSVEVWTAEVVDGIAVLSIDGPLEHKGSWFWESYENIARNFKTLLDDPIVTAVVLKIDSPGGEVAGLNESVRLMQSMKRAAGKPVIAYVDEACYSAAYALAMVADEIYLPESGGVGSIGVITALADVTKADEKAGVRVEVIASGSKKTDGHPHVALSDGAIKRTQRTVDRLAVQFFDLVAESRPLKAKEIAALEAGVFLGAAGVEAGLADGVMSLAECLTFAKKAFSSSIGKPAKALAPSEKDQDMTTELAAMKILNDANASLGAAKSDGDRALAAAKILAAEKELAKVKKMKTTDKTVHTEEVDDGGDDDEKSDAAAEEEPESTDGGDDVEEDEDEKKGKKAAASSATGLHTPARLLRLCRQITGKRSLEEVMGALDAMHVAHKDHAKLAQKVAKLEADANGVKLSALIESGVRAGKIAPAQRAWAKTQTPAGLRAYLDAAPALVHTSADEHVEARVSGNAPGAVTAEMAKIWRKQGFEEKDFPKLLESMNRTTNGASRANGAS